MSVCGHSEGLGFRIFPFPQPQSTLPTERNVKLCCHLRTLKGSMVISVDTQSVAVWYSGPLYILQLGIADRFMYCSLQCGSLV